MDPSKFTPVQLKMLEVLSDGRPHTKEELHACLADELGPLRNICAHITGIRKQLQRRGEDIECIAPAKGRRTMYRHIRLLASAVDGKR